MRTIRIHHRKDDQWKRHFSRFGEIAISRRFNRCAFIPRHTPHISVNITRDEAAAGLREWRKSPKNSLTLRSESHGCN